MSIADRASVRLPPVPMLELASSADTVPTLLLARLGQAVLLAKALVLLDTVGFSVLGNESVGPSSPRPASEAPAPDAVPAAAGTAISGA